MVSWPMGTPKTIKNHQVLPEIRCWLNQASVPKDVDDDDDFWCIYIVSIILTIYTSKVIIIINILRNTCLIQAATYFRKNLTGDAEAAAQCVVHPPSSTVYAQWSKKPGKKQWNKLHCTDLAATLREVYWGEFLKQLIIRANSSLAWASGKPLALSTSQYLSLLFSSSSATSLLISSVGMLESITITSCKSHSGFPGLSQAFLILSWPSSPPRGSSCSKTPTAMSNPVLATLVETLILCQQIPQILFSDVFLKPPAFHFSSILYARHGCLHRYLEMKNECWCVAKICIDSSELFLKLFELTLTHNAA